MEMQDVDYELVYEPGKDEADPLDYLSRHPLPETGNEKIIRWNVKAEHTVVITGITEPRGLLKETGRNTRDKDLEPYLHVKQELSVSEGLIFREHRVVKLGHSLGHLGKPRPSKC